MAEKYTFNYNWLHFNCIYRVDLDGKEEDTLNM